MKIVYFGTSEFAIPTLLRLKDSICLVVTQPVRPHGRGLKLVPSPLKQVALDLGLLVLSPEKSRDQDFIQMVKSLDADFNLVAAYGQIMSQNLLDSSRQGSFNLHGSILPFYRGAAPIQRAIENGDKETGISLMKMDRGMDTGDVIAIEKLKIGDEETYGELQSRLAILASNMAEKYIDRLASGDFVTEPQNNEIATYAGKVDRFEGEIRFEMTVLEAHRRYRAFTPNPGAYIITPSGRIKVLEARMTDFHSDPIPGTAIAVNSVLLFGFADGWLEIKRLQIEGKRAMSGHEWIIGRRMVSGHTTDLIDRQEN